MNVGVFCSASDLSEKYVLPARQLAKLIAEHGHSLVWGGSDTGVMKVMADGVQAGGGKIFGVSVEILRARARPDADEMVFAKDLGERKAMLLARSDAVVVLPGGLGTLDELSEILELRKARRSLQAGGRAEHGRLLRRADDAAQPDVGGRVHRTAAVRVHRPRGDAGGGAGSRRATKNKTRGRFFSFPHPPGPTSRPPGPGGGSSSRSIAKPLSE